MYIHRERERERERETEGCYGDYLPYLLPTTSKMVHSVGSSVHPLVGVCLRTTRLHCLLVLSRENGNTIPVYSLYNIFPYTLPRTSKMADQCFHPPRRLPPPCAQHPRCCTAAFISATTSANGWSIACAVSL